MNFKMRWGINHVDDFIRIDGDSKDIKMIIDVGANVGTMTRTYAERFPDAIIYVVEPVEETFNKLRKDTLSVGRVSAVQLALGNKPGTADCFIHNDSKKNTLIPGLTDDLHSEPRDSHLVNVCTLYDFVEQHGILSIDLLKIDTEGFDLAVIQGAEKSLNNQSVVFIYFEFHQLVPRKSATQLGSLVEIAELLDKYGYRFLTTYTDSVHGAEPIGTYNALFVADKSGYSWKY